MKANEKTSVATFSDLEKAEGVKRVLDEAGVPSEVVDESKLQHLWFVSKSLAGEKVVVDQKDFDRARAVLKIADESTHLLRGEVRCPECGSANIEYPQFTRKFMTTTLVEVCCFLHLTEKQFFCTDCQHMWPDKHQVETERDILNWPKGDKVVSAPKT